MHRIKKTVLILITVTLIGFLVVKIKLNQDRKVEIENNVKTLPDCQLFDVHDNTFKLESLRGRQVLLMAFDPDCDHCIYDITQIKQHLSQFGSTQIIFITLSDTTTLERFIRDQELNRYVQIKVLRSEPEIFFNTFGNTGFPAFYIYNKSGKLIKTINGEMDVEIMINYLPAKN